MGKDLRRLSGVRLLCCFFALGTLALAARSSTAAEPSAAQSLSADSLGRNSPYGTVEGFLSAMVMEDNNRAIAYLEGTQSAERKTELARALKEVLDRATNLKLADLSRERIARPDPALERGLEKIGTATYEDQRLDILLHQNPQQDALPIWLFSSETLSHVQDIADRMDLSWGEKIWPKSFRTIRFLGVSLDLWINGVLLVPLALALAWLFTRGLHRVLDPVMRYRFKEDAGSALAQIARPIYLLSFALVIRIGGPLAATLRIRVFFTTVASVLIITTLTWLLVRMTLLAAKLKERRLRQANTPGDIAATEIYSWLFVCLWVVGGIFFILRFVGFNVSTALAGLGVGGIAVAFAAQKTIENLFGTVAVISDRAIRVGDRCQVGNVDGWVESIGIRSTQIRALDRSLVSVPNGQLAMMNLGNLERRDKFLYHHQIRLRYETTVNQLREVLKQILQMMTDRSEVEPASLGVRLVGFGESSLDLAVAAHILVPSERAFLDIQQELLLRTMDIIEASGTRIALPCRTTYLAKDAPADAEIEATANRGAHGPS